MTNRGVAVVTGASSGIGRATARRLAQDGFEVIAAARRLDRLQELAAETGCRAVRCDVTDPDDVAALAAEAGDRVTLLVNNAGGAIGLSPVAEADLAEYRMMFETNVLGTVAVTKALLPALVASGQGTIITITSIAGQTAYEGGGGYNAAKFAEVAVSDALRLELNGQPVRVCDIAPGMVESDEFSLVRFDGDAEKAAKVYEGVDRPLTQEDVAECIAWVAELPHHVNVDKLTVKPVAQAAAHKVHRGPIYR
ncbi:NADP-dependent 3-hydroxy acid dehydrogenase YdfG [Austwickia chelonae]|uniref:Putative oxidoreductase n=1 Tax=Austwickia chelonae NBRC 105200 TaxID=1184607 RepID=K6VNC8_9MICO|nr:SDR family NAD(P)-dependent oxidoreductase [Austwickia chelonae]GAB76885.1 putative oxidoreductase [Austwickia chelonae NBRC 105200]SEW31968.1 NADP-dependent 3-hydroxy acid dehydrogenase YdfG [Austwickia chelonae]